jgi:hypothetical protein
MAVNVLSSAYEITRRVPKLDGGTVVKVIGYKCPVDATELPLIKHGEHVTCPTCYSRISLWGAALVITE